MLQDLKSRAKSLLASNPALYRPLSNAFRSIEVLRGMAYVASQRSKVMMGSRPIVVDYHGQPRPRWDGAGHPELARIIGDRRADYAARIREFGRFRGAIENIALGDPGNPLEPTWTNDYFNGIDAVALYGTLATLRPRRYFEIGSGFSTKLARRAVRDQGLPTKMLSIDPFPRSQIDELCDVVVRRALEDVDATVFDELEAGDILFFDGSHHTFMSSDGVVLFLEVMPRLRSGVLVHIHDIFLPYDYPATWADRYYTEQYMLAMGLMSPGCRWEIVFPSQFVMRDAELAGLLHTEIGPRAEAGAAASFWLRIV